MPTDRVGVATVLLALVCLVGCGPREPATPHYENLVVVLVDTLRSDHLPSYGYERDTAPYLAELAAEGIQVQGYSASSWTKASVGTLLTGLYPQRHQAISRSDSLPAEVPYLPQVLAGHGFSTAAYVGNKNVGWAFGFERGYSEFYQYRPASKVDAPVVTDRSLSLADGLEPPFFLYAHYVDPHDPYKPAEDWPDPEVEALAAVQPRFFQGRGAEPATPQERRRMIAQYDGEVREVDREIRRLIEGLEARGLLDGTLVIVTSDHGEEFQEHGGWTHGRTLYEEVLRVPFLAWSASPPLPRRRDAASFQQVDFLPTMLEALGIEEKDLEGPDRLDGTSRWTELVHGGLPETGPAYFHLDLDGRGALAIEEGTTKLLHQNRPPYTRAFDLAADPGEEHPLEAPSTEMLETLLRHHNRLGILAAQRQRRTLDDETRKGLAALGYLQLDTPEEDLAARAVPRKLDREKGFEAIEEP